MLGKLFKYEWRSISKLLLPIHGFVLLFALLSRFYFTISGGTDALLNTDSTIIGTLTMLLIFALVIVISSIAIFTYIYSGYHFHKNVFTDQGYLTNTLPVTPSQLLLSKELAALLWLLIDVVVISISIFILVGSTELFSNFSIFWSTLIRYASQTPLFTTLIIIALVLSPFLAIGILFFSITLGNLASSHKYRVCSLFGCVSFACGNQKLIYRITYSLYFLRSLSRQLIIIFVPSASYSVSFTVAFSLK